MRNLLIQAACIDECDDNADELLAAFADGDVTSMQVTLALSCSYVECAKAIQMLQARMKELEEIAARMRETA